MTTSTTARAHTIPPADRLRSALADRVHGLPAWVVLTQLFFGFGWLRAAVEKLIDPRWWSGHALVEFLVEHDGAIVPWYQPFVDLVVSPAAVVIAVVVLVAQLVAGLSLISGRRVAGGLVLGMFLNLNFIAAGAVNPSAFYLLSQGALALWLAEQSRSGRSLRRLAVVAVIAATLAVMSLPFVSTLDPANVIDDPAAMFAFGGILAVIACELAHRSATGGDGLP